MRVKLRKKGVSLVELILSIAVLSILSVYVIQMFITSKTLNRKAEELDYSVLISQSIFETIEKDITLDTLFNDPLFKFATRDDKDDITQAVVYFDENWLPLSSNDAGVYTLKFDAQRIQALDYSMVEYKISVLKDENLEVEPIYEIEMQKYY